MGTAKSFFSASVNASNVLTVSKLYGNKYCLTKKGSTFYSATSCYCRMTQIELYGFDNKKKSTIGLNATTWSKKLALKSGTRKATDNDFWSATGFPNVTLVKGSNKSYKYAKVFYEIHYNSATGTKVGGTFNFTQNLTVAYNTPTDAPSVSIDADNNKITVSASNLNNGQPTTATKANIVLQKKTGVNSWNNYKTASALSIKNNAVSYTFTKMDRGSTYRAAVSVHNSGYKYSTGAVNARPLSCGKITSAKADSATQATVKWTHPGGYPAIEKYTVEYTADNWDNFNQNRSAVRSADVTTTSAILSGLNSAHTYYFRVKATASESAGDSDWTEKNGAYCIKVGTIPTTPTVYLDSTTALDDPTITASSLLNTFRWVHNSEDNSAQEKAQVDIKYYTQSGSSWSLKKTESVNISDDINYYDFYNTRLQSDSNLRTRPLRVTMDVTTKGFRDEWSPHSSAIAFTIYDKATISSLSIQGGSEVTSFPFIFNSVVDSKSQKAINQSWIIVANDNLELVQADGSIKKISKSSTVWSYSQSHVPTDYTTLSHTFNAGDVAFDTSNASYKMQLTTTFETGVSATKSSDFTINIQDDGTYMVDSSFDVNKDDMSLNIYPNMVTDTGAEYFTPYSKENCLSVYRKSHEGDLILIADGIESGANAVVTDKHPSLDYAEYRIVAITPIGSIIYDDIAYTGEAGENAIDNAIIIQWNEDTDNIFYDYGAEITEESEDDADTNSTASDINNSTMLRLPYNVQISEDYGVEKELVNYVGRNFPVSYYGTQKNHTSTWQAEIPKTDTQTLTAIRHLASWQGDAYVREPNGSSYWANISVSFNINYNALTIPVTFKITHVEGDA